MKLFEASGPQFKFSIAIGENKVGLGSTPEARFFSKAREREERVRAAQYSAVQYIQDSK